jgi:hypothetical protein
MQRASTSFVIVLYSEVGIRIKRGGDSGGYGAKRMGERSSGSGVNSVASF